MKNFLGKLHASSPHAPVSEHEDPAEKGVESGVKTEPVASDTASSDNESLEKDAQHGVQSMEATTLVWSKRDLILCYVLIWVFHFTDTMQQGMASSLTPYVTSSFLLHSLTATTSIVSSIVGGVSKLPLAKILDIWGRPQGFALMVFFLTVGLIMMAACKNVETYAAAQVFYWVGQNGVTYILSIFVADTSALKNRGLMLAFLSSPYLATTWIGGPLATAFYKGPGFQWGFGAFAIIMPVTCSPILYLFSVNYNKAKRMGLITDQKSGRTWSESAKYYCIEFDVIGLFLITAGLAIFLLPFSLYSYQADGWKSALVISMIIIGGLLVIGFVLYERFVAPKTFIPFSLLTDRTVLGACCLAGVSFISFYLWDGYFSSFLQVVYGLSITEASYVGNIYTIGSCLWSFVVGILIRQTGRFKWLSLYFGVPLTILGVGLMVHFRQPGGNIGFIIMCQIFIAFAGGTNVICQQTAAMAASPHQYIAVVLAIENMFSSIGGAIGNTAAAALWTGVFPQRLLEYLPEESKADYLTIYGSLVTQTSYPEGSATRLAIQRAYGDAQKYMLIAGTSILALSIACVAVWRDIRVKDFKQVKGRVVN